MALREYQSRSDLLSLATTGLEVAVKESIINDLVAEHVRVFEEELRAHLRDYLAKYTFEAIYNLHDLREMRTEVRLSIQFSDEDEVRHE